MVTVSFNQRGISLEGKQKLRQAPSEKVEYTLLLTPWSLGIEGTPTILKVVDIIDPSVDLVSTIFPSGSVTEVNNEITLPLMQALVLGKKYKVHVNFTDGTSTFEAAFIVECRN